MQIDLGLVPFSRRGSWFALGRRGSEDGLPEGLYLRTVHGDAQHRELFRLDLVDRDGVLVPFTAEVAPELLTLMAPGGVVEICMPEPERLLVRGQGVGLLLTGVLASPYDLLVERAQGRWRYIGYGANLDLTLVPLTDRLAVDMAWNGVKAESLTIAVHAGSADRAWLLGIEETGTADVPRGDSSDFDGSVAAVAQDFAGWLERTPRIPPELAEARRTAAYVNWSAMVDEGGLVRRPSMLMSKNVMTSVWSWDHCFNALALHGDVPLACDQIRTIFDHQDEFGALPDSFNDTHITYNFAKPPVHGWALLRLMELADVPDAFLAEIEEPLARWTEWWLTYRDDDGDGLPHYHHGNDSGWDNATTFQRFVPVESPDLSSFLVLQMEALAVVADRLGRPANAAAWRTRADVLLAKLLEAFWTGDRFVARHARTHELVDSDSLLSFVPLVLGQRLPTDVFQTLAAGLVERGFLTAHGLATESPTSPAYESDGYWRGPIWAPATMLVVDGLADGGREDLATEISHRFCATVARAGFAENFDALTGEGLRDRAYTWTSSVFLLLAERFGL